MAVRAEESEGWDDFGGRLHGRDMGPSFLVTIKVPRWDQRTSFKTSRICGRRSTLMRELVKAKGLSWKPSAGGHRGNTTETPTPTLQTQT